MFRLQAACRGVLVFRLAAWLLLIGTIPPAFAAVLDHTPDDRALTDLDRRMMAELTGVKAVEQLVLHYRPADFTAEQIEACAQSNVRSFRELEKLLDMKYAGTVHIFLYRDTDDLKQMTGTGAVAFSTGTVSVHQPRDFVSVHELCHIFAMQFPRVPDGVSDIFVVEGLATILAETDQNVPIQAWVSVYGRVRRLPPLWDFRWRWPDKTPKGVHPYHVAGSFVGYLIEQYGIGKVKQWYVNATEAQSVFGRNFSQLERDWREWLAKRPIDPAHERHVLGRLKLLDARVPEAVATAAGERIFNGESLAGLEPESPERWNVRDHLLTGHCDGPWTTVCGQTRFLAGTAVRVRFRLADGNAFKIRLDYGAETGREAIFARWSAYLISGEKHDENENARIDDADWHIVVVTTDAGRLKAYLDGFRVMECDDAPTTGEFRIGVAVERGTVEISELAAIRP